ncbi:sugar ABC transporter substrate-binding protein [Sanguibacter sp. 25GB23B1]|uniref:ABC transporter substrate-binding protein n=1 Tax=unclassified Sanguibacter TaxID=2645534 RepID=UPI0032AF7A7D
MKRIVTKGQAMRGVGVSLAAALLLTGCGGESESRADGKTELTISVWNLEGTPEFNALFDAYEAANPDIDIKPVDILADDYAEKVTAMLAGGDTTDVLTMKNVTDYSRYATRGQLADITDLAEATDQEALAGLESFDQDGTYFALPYRQDFWALYYNKTVFDELGLEYPADLTWDEYVDLAEKITTDAAAAGLTPSTGPTVYGTYHHVWRSVVQAISAAQTGDDLVGGEYEFFEPYYERALGLQDAGATLDFSSAKSQQVTYQTMFSTGQAAMLPMGSWYISSLLASAAKGETTFEWGIAQMPQEDGADSVTTFGSPTAFAVNAKAKNTDAAKDFVAWAAGPEGAKAAASIGTVPALQSDEITTAYFALEGMPQDDLSKAAFEPDEIVLEMPVSEVTSDVDQVLMEQHDLIMTGSVSLEDGIAEMGERVRNEALQN